MNKLNLKRDQILEDFLPKEAVGSTNFTIKSPHVILDSWLSDAKRPKMDNSWVSSSSSGFQESILSEEANTWLATGSKCDQVMPSEAKAWLSPSQSVASFKVAQDLLPTSGEVTPDDCQVTPKSCQVTNWLVRSLHEAMEDANEVTNDDESSIAVLDDFDMVESDLGRTCDQEEDTCDQEEETCDHKASNHLGFWLV